MNKKTIYHLISFSVAILLDRKRAGYRNLPSRRHRLPDSSRLPGSGRQVYNFNPGWRFFRGDVQGAEAVNFDDRSWNVVSTPHTVELMPVEGSGCRNYQGPAWYRKHFVLPAETKGKRVVLHFEAAMGKQILYLNGKRIQEHLGRLSAFYFRLDRQWRTSRRLLSARCFHGQQ